MEQRTFHPQFITATIYEWKHLLKPDKYKKVILDSLRFLVEDGRINVYAFCIMSNHIHVIWQMREGYKREDVQLSFLNYTAQKIKFDLIENHPEVLTHFEVNLNDRKYQFWLRNTLAIELFTREVFNQKVDYIHNNPVKAGLCEFPEDYRFSSASYYFKVDKEYSFLSHYLE